MSKTAEVSAFKARVVPGAVLEVVEQTYKPGDVGTRRTVTKAHAGQYACTVEGREGDYWGTWPTRVANVTFPDADSIRYPLPARDGHWVTLRLVQS